MSMTKMEKSVLVPSLKPHFCHAYLNFLLRKWGNFKADRQLPYLLTCPIPPDIGEPPQAVSLVNKECERARNFLKIHNERPKSKGQKKSIAVCVKGLDFPFSDLSVRIVEWFELLKILGADRVFIYEMSVHQNVSKVLEHYVKSGFADVTKISLPGAQPNFPPFRHLYLRHKILHKRQNELIPYNDCLYRNLYKYERLVLLDIDEIIVPKIARTWNELIKFSSLDHPNKGTIFHIAEQKVQALQRFLSIFKYLLLQTI